MSFPLTNPVVRTIILSIRVNYLLPWGKQGERGLRIFLNKPFQRFARKEGLTDQQLCEAVERAERGLLDADLGGGVIKQRIARPGGGRSGGYRSVILYRVNDLAFFVYGYPKSERENITDEELKGFKMLARVMLSYNEEQIRTALEADVLREVVCNEQDI